MFTEESERKTDVFGRKYIWIITTTTTFMSMEINVYHSAHDSYWDAEVYAEESHWLRDSPYKIKRDIVR